MRLHQSATLPDQITRFTRHDAMAATLGFPHHGKGSVLVDLERLQRVGNKQNIHELFQSAATCRTAVVLHQMHNLAANRLGRACR
jgi:hypothetical protein